MNRLLIGHKTAQEGAVFPCEQTNVCRHLPRNNRGLIEGGRRMYIGLGTILLIVLIIVLLIWVL
jgi:hypothetical protein